MCFHWKSLLRQVRINGVVQKVSDKVADEYYNTRGYESRIGAWASKQSSVLNNRDELLNSIEEYKKKYNNKKSSKTRLLVWLELNTYKYRILVRWR